MKAIQRTEFEGRFTVEGLSQGEIVGVDQRVSEVIALLRQSQSLVVEPNLLTLEGIDGSGKTTLALSLASKLKRDGKKVIILRGSGTTGMDDILKWARHEYKRDSNKKTILEDLQSIQDLQKKYQKEQHSQKKMQIAVQMQIQMFALQKKYLTAGYFVISDRGVLSACLGGRDRAQNYEQFAQLISMFPYLPIGPTFFVDIPVNEAVKRSRKKGEKPQEKDLKLKALSFIFAQNQLPGLLQKFSDLSMSDFFLIDGTQSQRNMLRDTISQFSRFI